MQDTAFIFLLSLNEQSSRLVIAVPGHARQRVQERGEIQALLPAIAALRTWDDIPVRQPVALEGEQATVVLVPVPQDAGGGGYGAGSRRRPHRPGHADHPCAAWVLREAA